MLFQRLIVISSLLLVSACAPAVVQKYEGPQRGLDKVAVLYHNTERGFKIYNIDNESVLNRFTTFNPDGWDEVHLEPGMHTLSGRLDTEGKYAIFRNQFKFDAGKKYRLMYEIDDIGAKARIYLRNAE